MIQRPQFLAARAARVRVFAGAPLGGLLAVVLLASCASQGSNGTECSDTSTSACVAARDALQKNSYSGIPPDRLIAAASRALGDLNFETSRDDDRGTVSGHYLPTAATHKKQLDDLFLKAAKEYSLTQSDLLANIEVHGFANDPDSGEVKLSLYSGVGNIDHLVERKALYQVFFSQLGQELGSGPEPVKDRTKVRRKDIPSAPISY